MPDDVAYHRILVNANKFSHLRGGDARGPARHRGAGRERHDRGLLGAAAAVARRDRLRELGGDAQRPLRAGRARPRALRHARARAPALARRGAEDRRCARLSRQADGHRRPAPLPPPAGRRSFGRSRRRRSSEPRRPRPSSTSAGTSSRATTPSATRVPRSPRRPRRGSRAPLDVDADGREPLAESLDEHDVALRLEHLQGRPRMLDRLVMLPRQLERLGEVRMGERASVGPSIRSLRGRSCRARALTTCPPAPS